MPIEMILLIGFFWVLFGFLKFNGIPSPEIWIVTIVLYVEFYAVLKFPKPAVSFILLLISIVYVAFMYWR